MRQTLVNYSSPDSWYPRGQKRLETAMRQFGFDGEMYMFSNNAQFGSPTHKENPYGFKIHAIQYALDRGAEIVWWMDSSIFPVKYIKPILDIVEEKGYFFEQCGYTAAQWTNDKTLQYFGLTRDDAEKVQLFSAGFMVLDFRKELVREFFARFKNSYEAGMFKGAWTNANNSESNDPRCSGHRHDLSCASIIAHKLNMELQTCGTYLSYVGQGYGTPKESSIFYLQPAV